MYTPPARSLPQSTPQSKAQHREQRRSEALDHVRHIEANCDEESHHREGDEGDAAPVNVTVEGLLLLLFVFWWVGRW